MKKKLLLKNCLSVQENKKKKKNMLLRSDFIRLYSLGWQEDDSLSGMTVALFLGHTQKPSFHLLL